MFLACSLAQPVKTYLYVIRWRPQDPSPLCSYHITMLTEIARTETANQAELPNQVWASEGALCRVILWGTREEKPNLLTYVSKCVI